MFLRHNALGLLWALFIFILCALPGGQFEGARHPHLDKVIHVILFAVLFVLTTVGFIKQKRLPILRSDTKLKVWVGCVVYGIAIEFMQGFVFVDRSIELVDMISNAIGATIGLGVFLLIYGNESYT